MAIIRKKPLFEIYLKDDFLVINNTDFKKDNGIYDLESMQNLELIKSLSFFNKIIEVIFGLNVPSKSVQLRINTENGVKDILLTDCDIQKVEILVYEINQLNDKHNIN